jgi:3-oxoacyl-ACP reductase-like protein
MSIFSDILTKIFPASHPAVVAAQGAPTGSATSAPATAAAASVPTSAPAPVAASAPAATPMPEVDVEALLGNMAQKNPEKLNWRTSIVDLLKLLGLDSSINARKQLAAELHYSGDTNDSASMNMWLQKQVMAKLEQNGGKVPADLK